jgi:hypothetical protein
MTYDSSSMHPARAAPARPARSLPGGCNRFTVVTKDLDRKIDALRKAGVVFRGGVAEAAAGRQVLLEDPSGNVVELFEYADPWFVPSPHRGKGRSGWTHSKSSVNTWISPVNKVISKARVTANPCSAAGSAR